MSLAHSFMWLHVLVASRGRTCSLCGKRFDEDCDIDEHLVVYHVHMADTLPSAKESLYSMALIYFLIMF